MKKRELLESMATYDREGSPYIDHRDGCGHCYMLILYAECAREVLAEGSEDLDEWNRRVEKRWRESKYVQLYQEELAAGRDPAAAFEARGWQL